MKTRKGLDDDHLTYLDAGRIAQEAGVRRDRAARPHRRAGLLRRRPTGTRSPRWSTTSTSRCSATATSGRPPTRSAWSSRPASPAWSSAAAAWAGRGCSATWPPPSPASGSRTLPTLGEVRDDDAPARRAAERAHGGGARLQGVPQARLVVPQGVPRRRRRCGTRWRWSTRWPPSTCCSPSSTRTSRSRSPSWARRAAGRARRAAGWCCPRAGWTTPTARGSHVPRGRHRGHGRITARITAVIAAG